MITVKDVFTTILKRRSAIYGVLAIWVMLFHIAMRIGVPGNPGVVTPLINMGNVAVDVFLLLSGYCVYQSWVKDHNLFRFYLKRVVRILIPYLIFAIPLYLWKNAVELTPFSIKAFIGDVSTFNFWVHGMQTTWYVCAIFLFYAIVPLLSLGIRKNKLFGILTIAGTVVLNQILWLVLPTYHVTSIVWTRLPVFTLGVFLSCHGSEIVIKRPKLWKCIFVLLAVLLTIVFPYRDWYKNVFGNNPEYLWTGYILLAPGLLWLLYKTITILSKWILCFLNLVGAVSLEIYIIHVFI